MKILLDTNFVLVPAQFKVDIYRELEGNQLLILEECARELLKLLKKKGAVRKQAVIALALIKTKAIKVVKSEGKAGPVDRLILDYALSARCAVATNDIGLIKALKKHSIKVIRLRQKKVIIEE